MDVDLGQLTKPCVCGREHSLETELVVIKEGAVEQLMDILENYQNPVFICDSNTRAAAEPYLEEEFKDYPVIEMNPKKLQADNKGVKKIMMQIDYCDRGLSAVPVDILVAIGAGTIHDLTRYAATEYDIPFVSIPTAASVDGFSANCSALTWDGLKKTIKGAAPKWILADTRIFAKAPYRLTASGVGDFLGKYISLLDWRVSHLMTDEYFCEEVCELLEKALKEVSRVLDDIRERDPEAIEKLMSALILSGLVMQMVQNPRPISGAEHMVAHLWEMGVIKGKYETLHGEKVAVGLVMVTDQYKKLGHNIRHDHVELNSESSKYLEMGLLEKIFPDPEIFEGILAENEPNVLEDIDMDMLWEKRHEIEDLIKDLPDTDTMVEMLKEAGCKTTMEDLGINPERYNDTINVCSYVRLRLSLLRLAKLFKDNRY